MRLLLRPATFVALLLWAILSFTPVPAQTVQKQATGVISGRVTSGDKGIANISIQLYAQESASTSRGAVASTKTDYQGNYRLTNIAGGRYTVAAIAPTMVGHNDGPYGPYGQPITIADGETIEKLDFALARGGVITGRVTDMDGAPVIGERIQLTRQGQQDRMRSFAGPPNPYMYQTDDRGVYRIYGLLPGSYTVAVGQSKDGGPIRFGVGPHGYFTMTFYPSVTEPSKAVAVEVGEGSEATNIDITVGRREKSYAVAGRVVDESGQPAPNVHIGYGAIMRDDRMGGFMVYPSDAEGHFRLDGLMPGRYAATIWNDGTTGAYSDLVRFEILDSDVSGLEIKLRRGASLSGVAVVEGAPDRSALSQLTKLLISVVPIGDRTRMILPEFINSKIAPDGTFTLKGLRPGKVKLYLSSYPPVPGFTLARVERDGVPQQEFEITSGAQIAGVRVVLAYGSGKIRGLVKTDADSLPDLRRMVVGVRPVTEGLTLQVRSTQVDSRGRFLIEGLSSGEYEVILNFYPGDGSQRRPQQVKQRVSVSNGVESEVTLTINTGTTQPEGGSNE